MRPTKYYGPPAGVYRLSVYGLSSQPPSLLYTSSFGFSKTSSLPVQSTLQMPCSAEKRSRRAAKERERRAVESPASRQARLDFIKAATRDWRAEEPPPSRQARLGSVNASTRGRRHALTLESSITAKRRNSCMRAELRRQAADVAAANIGVMCAVTSLIMTLLITFYGFTHVPAPSESWTLAVSLTSRKPAFRLLSRFRLLAKTYSRRYAGAYFFVNSRHGSMS